MSCETVKFPGGAAIVCSRRPPRCAWCSPAKPSAFLCDWKVAKGRTCDKAICSAHAKEVAKDKHLCPEHQKAYEAWLARREPSDEERAVDAEISHALGLDVKGS